jgi:hypothetical protein
VIEVFSWLKGSPAGARTWLICGKGPSFERHTSIPDLDGSYATVGLNHACRARRMMVTHVADANVLDELPNIAQQTEWLLMPWQPHVQFKPTAKTLQNFLEERSDLKDFEARGRLLWYNCSSGPAPRPGSPSVSVFMFSAEAAVRILAMAGVKKIRTLGIDGGNQYAASFSDIPKFRGGHTTFDLQKKPIEATVKQFKLDYAPL